MASLPAHVVQAARDEAEEWERFRDGAAFASAGVVPTITAAAGAVVGAVCGSAAASMVMLGARKSRAANRKANDPPDPEYGRPVIARRAHFNEDAFGRTPIERATVDACYALLYSEAYDLAMVRAEERRQGANRAGDDAAAASRTHEAIRYARRSVEYADAVARTTAELAHQLEAVDYGHEPFDPNGVPRTLDRALPDETLVVLFRAGFRIEDLRMIVRGRLPVLDPLGAIASGLRAAGQSTGTYGRVLQPVIEDVFRHPVE